ncbi:MAG: hypothetical protein DMG43_08520 [Acidobacteria bacterium]|nr:MAG: hypothetical protein DMG43_08520 [Acidobacteriota bacterium]
MKSPTLEGFDEILHLVADRAQARDWILSSIVAGDEKVRVLRYISQNAHSGAPRHLDIGAQIGAMAIYASRLGCEVAAVDYACWSSYAAIAKENGVDYRECDLSASPLPFADASFDFVSYMDVIEHHAFSPRRVLEEIHRVLAPNGRVLVTTPNHSSIYNRLLLLVGRSVNDSFDRYFDSKDVMHLGHHREYTRSELRSALERSGFVVQECRVEEEGLSSLVYFAQRNGGFLKQGKWFVIRSLGPVWSTLHLPFGRRLWAVGVKAPDSLRSASS